MGFKASTLALFAECEVLANELARVNPNDELLFYSLSDETRTTEETTEMTILFIENFFPEGTSSNQVTEEVLVLALSEFRIALSQSLMAAPLLLKTIEEAKRNWI